MSRTWCMLCFLVSPHGILSVWFPSWFCTLSFLLALSHTHPLPSALQHIYSVVLCCVSEDRVGILYTLMTVFISGAQSQERGWMDGWMATVVSGWRHLGNWVYCPCEQHLGSEMCALVNTWFYFSPCGQFTSAMLERHGKDRKEVFT